MPIILAVDNYLLTVYACVLSLRNAILESEGFKPPKALKTGTTIAGIIFKVSTLVFCFDYWKM